MHIARNTVQFFRTHAKNTKTVEFLMTFEKSVTRTRHARAHAHTRALGSVTATIATTTATTALLLLLPKPFGFKLTEQADAAEAKFAKVECQDVKEVSTSRKASCASHFVRLALRAPRASRASTSCSS